MLKIETRIKPIEIEINGSVFSIPKTDETLKRIDNVAKELEKKSEEAKKLSSLDAFQMLRDVAIKSYDEVLGEGSFKSIEKSLSEAGGEYTFQMVNHFFKIYEHITQETLKDMDNSRYDKSVTKSN